MNWRTLLRDVVWTSVVAAGCGLIAVACAIAGEPETGIVFAVVGLVSATLGGRNE
jgi:hypothetical protein